MRAFPKQASPSGGEARKALRGCSRGPSRSLAAQPKKDATKRERKKKREAIELTRRAAKRARKLQGSCSRSRRPPPAARALRESAARAQLGHGCIVHGVVAKSKSVHAQSGPLSLSLSFYAVAKRGNEYRTLRESVYHLRGAGGGGGAGGAAGAGWK